MCAGERPSVDLGEIGWQRDRAQGRAAHHVSVASLPPVTVAVTVAIKLRCPNTSTAPRSLATVAASGLAAAGSVQVGEHVGGPLRVGREECHVFEVLWPGTFRNVLHQSAQQILARTVALLHDCTIARFHRVGRALGPGHARARAPSHSGGVLPALVTITWSWSHLFLGGLFDLATAAWRVWLRVDNQERTFPRSERVATLSRGGHRTRLGWPRNPDIMPRFSSRAPPPPPPLNEMSAGNQRRGIFVEYKLSTLPPRSRLVLF